MLNKLKKWWNKEPAQSTYLVSMKAHINKPAGMFEDVYWNIDITVTTEPGRDPRSIKDEVVTDSALVLGIKESDIKATIKFLY